VRCSGRRLGEPCAIADAIPFLASDAAAFVTGGQVMVEHVHCRQADSTAGEIP
jgi:NAD(P)-dependent dehydrogenase (short-subunit alcohol dehydrogenase family)